MITSAGFWKGRDIQFSKQLTDEIVNNAHETIRRANLLLSAYVAANPGRPTGDATSGWRPAAVNSATPNASNTSHHLMGRAVDIADASQNLDHWLITPAGLKALAEIGLWLESPGSTPTWCHVQTVAPRSGNRVFNP